ncbi:MAG: M1 family metallopeptidase [Pseudobacter sp.]|uniref:M1 family metallopeptidase n=1 Tax=Pseudobacter sp. TaxID=2045420 RepID=UPI003F80D221
MFKKGMLPLLVLLTGIGLERTIAQSLYMPADVRKAYANKTRSMDGRPGPKYWQNKARYNIQLQVNPPDRNVKGSEEIVYINNSPDTIRNPQLKLFLNIHLPGAARERDAYRDYLTSGVHIESIKANGQVIEWPADYQSTSMGFELPKALAPGDSVLLNIQWNFDVSVQSGREGMIDSTSFFLAYFYPRFAVYDDYNGWDRSDFTDGHEFYNDFNDYTVTIQVPKNFIVWGTGTLHQPEKLLQPEFAARYVRSLKEDKKIRIASREEMTAGKVTAQQEFNSWKFTSSHIPDVAFGLSDHYVWDAASVVVDEKTGRRASVQAAFNDTAADYHHMVGFAGDALKWFSRNWPGIPYPYEKMTVYQGYAGMEYPMMANDESYEDSAFSRLVANHEIAHTYMPFYMGINETRYGFMDEGWATTLELLIGYEYMGKQQAEELFKMFRVNNWTKDRSADMDLPIITPGTSLTGKGLSANQYGKAALGYLALKDMMGDAMFKKCLHAYMDRWHGKHPIPWDFFYTFNDVNGKSLDWFWNNWFFAPGYMDIGIEHVNKSVVTLSNTGGKPIPFDLEITFADGSKKVQHCTSQVWEANPHKATVTVPATKAIRSVMINTGYFLDANTADNSFTTR